jgi:hypothetical protein
LVAGKTGAGKDEFLFRNRIFQVFAVVVESVHGQLAIDQDGRLVIGAEKRDSATETPRARLPCAIHDGVRPDRDHPLRDLRLGFFFEQPKAVLQAEFGAAA